MLSISPIPELEYAYSTSSWRVISWVSMRAGYDSHRSIVLILPLEAIGRLR